MRRMIVAVSACLAMLAAQSGPVFAKDDVKTKTVTLETYFRKPNHTLLQYLLAPLTDSFGKAFR